MSTYSAADPRGYSVRHIRFGTIRFGFQVLFSVPDSDNDPDRLAICACPKTPRAIFDTFDGNVELNAPRTATLGASGSADAVNTPVRVCPVWDNTGDLMILWHREISFLL